MARKKAHGKMTKADAVRAAIAEGVDMPAEGAAYVKEKFGLDVTPQQFSTYKSIAKKKAGKAPGRRGRKPGAPASTAAVNSSTNGPAGLAIQVEAIKSLVDLLGVEQVVSIARLFGK
jgi:hypothetical protein